jgi:hypothetical protein
MSQLVEEAADALERTVFFTQLAARHEDPRADETAWSEIENERAAESGRWMTTRCESSPW